MSSSFNLFVLSGNVSREVELRMVPTGKDENGKPVAEGVISATIACARVTIAVAPEHPVKDNRTTAKRSADEKAGIKFDDGTDFIDVTVWGKIAQTCFDYLAVGRNVGFQGSLFVSKFVDKHGEKTSRLKAKATRMLFLDNKRVDKNIKVPALQEPDFDKAVVETPDVIEKPAPKPRTPRTRK
jgi:single-stranded DNA-binding protein